MSESGKMIDCGQALGRVWAYLDGELTDVEAREFESHVSHCSKCGQAHDFERRLLEAIRATEQRGFDSGTAALAERIRAAIRGGHPELG